MPRPALPIDPLLPELCAQLAEHGRLVLEAPPGAGKTTRVPVAMLEAGFANAGEIIVTEPRRLAARLVARHVARESGEAVGETVGFSVRFEDESSARTRIRYVTEGVLVRRLLTDHELTNVAAVVIDEVHERHLETDLLLSLLWRVSRQRPLPLVVMSATLQAEPIAALLDDAPRLRSEGRRFELDIRHLKQPDDRPLEKQVTSAVRQHVKEGPEGDVLVFLPGAAEIRRAQSALEKLAAEHELLVLPLHGDLSLEQQARAVSQASQRKVVLSTNVAESSVTIAGVTGVIDSGLARVAVHSPWTGVARLELARISQASATQRAGRAGRERPGLVQRLYTRGDLERRPRHELPEIQRADLAELVLALRAVGIAERHELGWLDAPAETAWNQAQELLQGLGASKGSGLSELGERLRDLPLPPRYGRVLVESARLGVGMLGATAVALLTERDIRRSRRTRFGGQSGGVDGSSPSDVLELLERFEEARDARFQPRALEHMGLDARACRAVSNSEKQLKRLARNLGASAELTQQEREERLARALLSGFGDRIARRRVSGSRDLILRGGQLARLAETSVVHEGDLLLVLDLDERRGGGKGPRIEARLVTQIDPDLVLERFIDDLEELEEIRWNDKLERVEVTSRLRLGSLTLEEASRPAPTSDAASAELARHAESRGIRHFDPEDRLEGLVERLGLLARPESSIGVDAALLESVGDTRGCLERACAGLTSFAELRQVDVSSQLLASSGPELQRALRELTPEHVTLAGGPRLKVHYLAGKDPFVESYLQDFFGSAEGPTILHGRLPLTLQLWAPNRRPIQVTRDLASFWSSHYPELRRRLSRRYPKHYWPEDPLSAKPTHRGLEPRK